MPSGLMKAGFQSNKTTAAKKKRKKKKKNSLSDWYIRVSAISNVGKTCGPTPCLTGAITMLKLN